MFHPINTEDIYIFFFLRFSLTINKKKNFFSFSKKTRIRNLFVISWNFFREICHHSKMQDQKFSYLKKKKFVNFSFMVREVRTHPAMYI